MATRRYAPRVLALSLSLASLLAAAHAQGSPFLPPLKQRVLDLSWGVPACYDPADPAHGACACAWDQLVSDSASHAFSALGAVVISPGSPAVPGPGVACDAGVLANVTRRMAIADPNVAVLGLVLTEFGQRPLAEALANIDAYIACYAPPLVGGFLLVDAPVDCGTGAQYLAALATLARAALGPANPAADGPTQVVLDVPSGAADCLLQVADVLVTFRGDFSLYETFEPQPWQLNNSATRFAHIVTGASFIDGSACVLDMHNCPRNSPKNLLHAAAADIRENFSFIVAASAALNASSEHGDHARRARAARFGGDKAVQKP